MGAFIQEFISAYGTAILYAILTAIAGLLGTAVKNLYQRYINDKTKKDVVKTCVQAVEQLYKDLHGDEKLQKACEHATEMLELKGISISSIELRMLIEAAVAEFNNAFNSTNAELPEPEIEAEASAGSEAGIVVEEVVAEGN